MINDSTMLMIYCVSVLIYIFHLGKINFDIFNNNTQHLDIIIISYFHNTFQKS